MRTIKHRDPRPTNRDPTMQERSVAARPATQECSAAATPAADVVPEKKKNSLICVPEVAAQCPKCKSTVSQIDATRPERERGFILKYRTCKACGNKFASRQDVPVVEKWPAVAGVDG